MHFTAKAILTGHRIHTTLTDQAAVNIPLDVQYVIFETIDYMDTDDQTCRPKIHSQNTNYIKLTRTTISTSKLALIKKQYIKRSS